MNFPEHPMDYNVITAAKMTEFVERVNDAIQDGWLPLEGGFQTQNVPGDAVRFMQAMVKVQPWSLKEIAGRIQGAVAAPRSEPMVIEAAPEKVPAKARTEGASKAKSLSKKTAGAGKKPNPKSKRKR